MFTLYFFIIRFSGLYKLSYEFLIALIDLINLIKSQSPISNVNFGIGHYFGYLALDIGHFLGQLEIRLIRSI